MRYPQIKRILDLASSLILLAILWPLLVFVGILALVFQGRPILFVQVRPGLHARPFKLLKFRTMAPVVEEPSGKSSINTTTRFGRVLRSLSLDELPQLVNIVRGDMSFVGPRPLLFEYLPLYSKQQQRRHFVRPGLTGLAQVEGRNQISWQRRLDLDVDYATEQSFLLDLRIMVKSIVVVLGRHGISAEGSETMPKFIGNGGR